MTPIYEKGKDIICTLLSVIFTIFTILPITAFAQDPAQYGVPFAAVPDPRDANIYQVIIKPYSAAGNLAGITARLDAIKALGVNVIYLMPIHPIGTDSRSVGSPYCIKDFKAIAPELGTLADLRALVDGAHNRGMAVMMDWVVNQTSFDHPWTSQHPDWYVRNSNGVIQPVPIFPDVAALNLNNAGMRAGMIDAMRYWIFAANIDGYRCDFANNPTIEFWTQIINNLRGISSHKLLMLAEGDRLQNFQAGFDFNFGDKWYYDALKKINDNGVSVAQIQTTTNTEYTYANSVQQVVRYTGNHDAYTNASPMTVFDGHNGVVANFLVSALMRGAPFLASSQEIDFASTIPFPWNGVKFNWSNTAPSADFARILNFRNSNNASRRGAMTNYSNANVCAFTKIAGNMKVAVLTNLRNYNSSYVVPAAMAGTYTDAFTGASFTLTSGSTINLSAFQYKVLTNVTSSKYYLVNRWKNTYLYDNNQVVSYGTSPSTTAYQWVMEDIDGFRRFRNLGTGRYLNIENLLGYVQCTNVPSGNWSSQWAVEEFNGYKRFRNRWQSTNYIHVENQNGKAQYGGMNPVYWSNHWTLQQVSGARLGEQEEEIANELFEVYPNPTNSGLVSINLGEDNRVAKVKIYDAQGTKIKEVEAIGSKFSVEVQSIKKGIYLMVVEGDKKRYSKKIVIE